MPTDKNLIVTETVLAVEVKAGCGDAVHSNRPSHGLALMTSGIKEYVFDSGESLRVCGGDVIYLPKHSSYTVYDIELGDCFAVNFEINEENELLPRMWTVKDFDKFVGIFERAESLWITRRDGFEFGLKACVYELLYGLKRLSDKAEEKEICVRIAPAVKYMDTKYTDPSISIAYLANLCNVSDTYFRRVFNRDFGTSPLKYIEQKRTELAKRLLKSGMYRVGEVCTMCGYTEVSVFSRAFKHSTGLSPSEFANSAE